MSDDLSPREPRTVGLDPDWISDALEREGIAPEKVTFDGFIGTGQMSRNARFLLEWPNDVGPDSVIVKLPSADQATREVSFTHNLYGNECEFYRSVASLVDIAVPESLAVHFDVEKNDFAIVLQDMTGFEQGDHFSELTDTQLALALEQAVALHAPLWGKTGRPECHFLRVDRDDRSEMMQELLSVFLPAVFERLGDGLEPDVVDLLCQFEAIAGSWSKLHSTPTTLVHGDFRADNFMFGSDPTGPPMVTVDWQTLGLGLGATDIAYLIGGSLEPARRRNIEYELLESYVSQLRQQGVLYEMAECRQDYALGALHGVRIAVTATTMANQTKRGDALFTLMLNRHGRHALDLGSLDVVARLVEQP